MDERHKFTVYLTPLGVLNSEIPKSDTLFGAICWAICLLYSESTLEDLLEEYESTQWPFKLSSAFPCCFKNGRYFHYYPYPLKLKKQHASVLSSNELKSQQRTSAESSSKFKSFNKIKYLGEGLFQEFLHGRLDIAEISQKTSLPGEHEDRAEFLLEKGCLTSKDMPIPQIATIDVTATAVNRLTGGAFEGKLHFSKVLYFKETSLFFLLEVSGKWKEKVLSAVRFLEDRGIGGGITRGRGAVKIRIKEGYPFEEPEDGDEWMTLSLYCPSPDEWRMIRTSADACYSVIQRKGRIESSFYEGRRVWKNSVLVMEEGSVFPVGEAHPDYGKLVPVLIMTGGKVARYNGLGFPVKVRRG